MLRLSNAQKRSVLLQDKRMILRELSAERLFHVVDLMLETISDDIPDEIIEEEFEEIHSRHLREFNMALYDEDGA